MLKRLFGRTYRTLNTISVGANDLRDNLNLYRRLFPGKEVCPVLKSNAYGHGLLGVANLLESEKCPFFAVDSLFEAYALYKEDIRTPLLILGFTLPENIDGRNLPFHFAVSDMETARAFANKKAPVHIKVDTGMNRMGFPAKDIGEAVKEFRKLDLNIVGVMTHVADPDNADDSSYTKMQLEKFRDAVTCVRAAGWSPRWIHAGQSGGALKQAHYEDIVPEINMIRLGLGLYGMNPLSAGDPDFTKLLNLKPAMEVRSTLVGIRTLSAGDRVSYNGTFTAEHDMVIGTVPFGYYEGLPRSLSNAGIMTVAGVQCPILGRVCMNYTVIDISKVTDPKIGDVVTVYSRDSSAPNSLIALAEKAGTISYELMVRLSESIRREVV
ncbi:MAG: alanine racemase [Patescibacteria group bacterium]